jgi:predicted acyl esterase
VRTPYGIEGGERAFNGAYAELARDGYIFVLQDIRGRYKSEGQFMMLRKMRDKTDKRAIDESTDTYDSIDWLLKNVPRNNGRVGMLGVSYPGWLTVVIAGDVTAHLFASTTGSDADWVVKVIDVYPDKYDADATLNGYQLMVANDVFRGRFRKSFEHPVAITPNRVDE